MEKNLNNELIKKLKILRILSKKNKDIRTTFFHLSDGIIKLDTRLRYKQYWDIMKYMSTFGERDRFGFFDIIDQLLFALKDPVTIKRERKKYIKEIIKSTEEFLLNTPLILHAIETIEDVNTRENERSRFFKYIEKLRILKWKKISINV